MNDDIITKCTLFVSDREAFDRTFRFADAFVRSASALICALRGVEVTEYRLEKVRDAFRGEVAALSYLRAVTPAAVALIAGSADPDAALDAINGAYAALKTQFPPSEQLCIAALLLSRGTNGRAVISVAEDALRQFSAFKKKRRFRTCDYDIPVSTALALAGADPEAAADEADACFLKLREKPAFRCTWALAEGLALCPADVGGKCAAMRELRGRVRELHRWAGLDRELGAVSAIADRTGELFDTAASVDKWLAENRRFNSLRVEASERLLLAFAAAAESEELILLALSQHMRKVRERAAAASS